MVAKTPIFPFWRGRFFVIFKTHVRASAMAIFRETPLNYTTTEYYNLVLHQPLWLFLHHCHDLLTWSRNTDISILVRSIFCYFQNASPRKCSGHFLRNSTQLKYCRILQTGRVSASVLISIPLTITCEHGRKIDITMIMGEVNFLQFSKCISA